MRVLFLSHYFPPEGNAPAVRTFETCRRWVDEGAQVTVVTCAPNVPAGRVYAGYANRWCQRERVAGIEVVRVWTHLAPNRGTVRRTLSYLSYLVTATLRSLLLPRPDVVVASSPQFFCGWAGVLASRLLRRPLVLEIRDLWPASISEVGAIHSRWILAPLELLERWMYAAAERIVTVGDGYRSQLERRGVPAAKIAVIPNGADLDLWQPDTSGDAIRRQYGLGARFVCAYVGTIGMACGLDVVLRAARAQREAEADGVVFLLVGDGAERQQLESEARRQGLTSVVFTGLLPRERIPQVLAAADSCLVHLRKSALFETVLPSKIFEAAAMRKPIILGVAGHAAKVLQEAGAGIAIEPENESALLRAIDRLRGDRELCRRLGSSGRDFVVRHYNRDDLAREYLEQIAQTAKSRD